MKQQFYQGMAYTDLALYALLLFVTFFVGVLVYVLLVRRRSDFDAAASLPLLADTTPAAPLSARAASAAQRGTP